MLYLISNLCKMYLSNDNIKKTSEAQMSQTHVRPGIHPKFYLDRFSEKEIKIIKNLSMDWYVTSSGNKIRLAASEYDFFLIKPTMLFSEMFNIEREVVCVFSPYTHFEPRTLDAFSEAEKNLSELRTERICKILISRDNDIEKKIDSLLKTDPEQPIIVPFTYDELLIKYDKYLIQNRFRKHFYSRNLFDFLSPLKSDLYFFGRSQLVQEVVNRHQSSEHTGLFGLRKSGKTSIIYAVERTLSNLNQRYISIDCENPSIHKLRWNELLKKIVFLYHDLIDSKIKLDTSSSRYLEKFAADSFEEDIKRIYTSKKKQNVLFIFDEIERITPGTASSLHWGENEDFIYFWQTLRGFYQRNPKIFTYMLVGTNPSCVEHAVLVGHDNPLFASIPCQYVPSFSVEQVREMVKKLGSYVGLNFDEIIFSKLTDDFGGHPFLIRQACSVIHNEYKGERPVKVDKALYEKTKKQFIENSTHYLNMVIQVLKDWYSDEYEMLKYLAQGDTATFLEFANDNTEFTRHLIGYGLIQHSSNGYAFNIESVKEYISNEHKYERINLSEEEKVEEVSRRRNILEKQLRKVIKNSLKINFGQKKALEKLLSSLPEKRRESLNTWKFDDLVAIDSSPLYFLELKNLVSREWDSFKNVFEMDKGKLILMLDEINAIGRPEAHAKNIQQSDFEQMRLYFNRLESILNEWA